MTVGVVLNGHRPLHNGHVYMIEFARNYADKLFIGVCTLSSEPIPGELRYQWTKEMFPGDSVVYCPDMPSFFNLHWDDPVLWARIVKEYMKVESTDFLFASEDYGPPIANALQAKYIPVDKDRSVIKVSASMIRANPMANWNFIPAPVRPYYVKRVCICGGSTGDNNEFAELLASRYNTVSVPEYPSDTFTAAVKGQIASENALAKLSNRIIFTAADPTTLMLRFDLLDKDGDLVKKYDYDIYFDLGKYDMSYVKNCGKNIIKLSGDKMNMMQKACMEVDSLIYRSPQVSVRTMNRWKNEPLG